MKSLRVTTEERARYNVVKALWNPSFFHSTYEERMTFWRLGKERGILRRRIEKAEREERERQKP